MNTKFTPGPWSVAKDSWADNHVDINAPGHGALAVVVTELDGRDFPEGKANATLIAAAPELLSALQDIKDAIDFNMKIERESEIHNVVRAAIAKALGESHE